ncbi:Protein T11A5.6 a [Aphelenchoides avenae]|nr:Protein T11A5.6 a [Aphelenchus avenae]
MFVFARLYIGGCWKVIVVDDFFPCDASTRQMIFAYARKKQLWVPLMKKALAKALGNYFSLDAASAKDCPCQYAEHCHFTGAPLLTVDLYPYYSGGILDNQAM